jgi:uncharacterized protein
MLRIAALALLLVGSSAPLLSADEKSHQAAVEELLVITKTPENLKSSITTMLDLQIKQAPPLAPLRKPMEKFFEKYLSYDALKDDLIKMYAAEFTEEEIKDLIKFYQTPLGKKTAEKMPVLTAKGAQLGASRVDAHKAELQQMIRDELLKPRTEPGKP